MTLCRRHDSESDVVSRTPSGSDGSASVADSSARAASSQASLPLHSARDIQRFTQAIEAHDRAGAVPVDVRAAAVDEAVRTLLA